VPVPDCAEELETIAPAESDKKKSCRATDYLPADSHLRREKVKIQTARRKKHAKIKKENIDFSGD
jgi:hypothetical protein